MVLVSVTYLVVRLIKFDLKCPQMMLKWWLLRLKMKKCDNPFIGMAMLKMDGDRTLMVMGFLCERSY